MKGRWSVVERQVVTGKGHAGGKQLSVPEVTQVSMKDCVRVATVDNFQGEESTIVILSLVRNNK